MDVGETNGVDTVFVRRAKENVDAAGNDEHATLRRRWQSTKTFKGS